MVVNCEQVWRELSNYLENDVDAGLRAAMDEHIRGCARCKSVLEGARNVIRLYGDERMIEVPAGYGRRLERRLAENVRASTRRWLTWSTWLVPVAALALIAGGLRLANSIAGRQSVKSEHAQAGRNIPPDLKVLVAADTKIFHVPGCTFIHDKDQLQTMTAKQALDKGYVPCARCMRKYLETARAHEAGQDTAWTEREVVEREDLREEGH